MSAAGERHVALGARGADDASDDRFTHVAGARRQRCLERIVAVLAACLPALRAANIDPNEALRVE